MAVKKVAKVKVSAGVGERPVLHVAVPSGTTVKGSLRVIQSLDSIIERLTGCPCFSGFDIKFHDDLLKEKAQNFSQNVGLG